MIVLLTEKGRQDMKAKYVVYEGKHGFDVAVVFSPFEDHSQVIQGFTIPEKVLGAGAVSIRSRSGKVSVECFGESATLKIHSRGTEDEVAVIKSLFPEPSDRMSYANDPKKKVP